MLPATTASNQAMTLVCRSNAEFESFKTADRQKLECDSSLWVTWGICEQKFFFPQALAEGINPGRRVFPGSVQ